MTCTAPTPALTVLGGFACLSSSQESSEPPSLHPKTGMKSVLFTMSVFPLGTDEDKSLPYEELLRLDA
jgi:hypothetical protein